MKENVVSLLFFLATSFVERFNDISQLHHFETLEIIFHDDSRLSIVEAICPWTLGLATRKERGNREIWSSVEAAHEAPFSQVWKRI